jgi:hypothetical protein
MGGIHARSQLRAMKISSGMQMDAPSRPWGWLLWLWWPTVACWSAWRIWGGDVWFVLSAIGLFGGVALYTAWGTYWTWRGLRQRILYVAPAVFPAMWLGFGVAAGVKVIIS